jgi:hypothetical protein
METANFIKLVAKALLSPSLTTEELRFLHTLHLRLLAHGSEAMTDQERQCLMMIIADQQERDRGSMGS